MGGVWGVGTGRSPVPTPHTPPFPFACSFPVDGPVLYPPKGRPGEQPIRSGPYKADRVSSFQETLSV